jgi:hypothetical protein
VRFLSDKDVKFFQQINRELLDEVIETMVIIYKLEVESSPTNIYGEAPRKLYFQGTQLPGLVRRSDKQPTTDGNVIDFNQVTVFSFQRETLKERGIYPEVGDIIEYDSSFWEINNASENQLIGGQPFFNFSIVCTAHMTRQSALQLTERSYPSNNEV